DGKHECLLSVIFSKGIIIYSNTNRHISASVKWRLSVLLLQLRQ
ncbi:hypothetical protein GCK32_017806, partial [Trichostrongylus colubriformis]